MLKPGQTIEHRCTITATADSQDIERLLRLNR
jgi:hypothetical protein